MVQLRASLEAVVMQAWRDRWSELEWSINLKAALMEDTSELNKLCGMLLKQATLSEVPNTLMFSYLSYTVAAQIVPHTSLLEAVIGYRDFSRELCIEAVLELLNDTRDRLKCQSCDAFQCERLCSLLTETMGWLVEAVEGTLQRHNTELLRELIGSLLSFTHSPFLTLCLYFHYLEAPEGYRSVSEKTSGLLLRCSATAWVPENVTKDFRSFAQKFNSIPELFFVPTRSMDPRELNPGGAHGAMVTAASVLGSARILETPERMGEVLGALALTFRLPWWILLRDFLRGAFLLQLDPGPRFPESGVTAFLYLKVPRVMEYLVKEERMGPGDIVRAVQAVASFHPLLNSLDIRSRSNCFVPFVEESRKLLLLTESEAGALTELRNRERTTFLELSPTGGQPGIQLVLKGNVTLHTLMKSFKSEMVVKHDKLVQMLSHMITGGGKSFEYICAAASATSLLTQFTSSLVQFNGAARLENGDPPDVRCRMFDLSFLLLSRISFWFGFNPVSVVDGKSRFLDSWFRAYGSGERGSGAHLEPPAPSRIQPDALIQRLRQGEAFWDKASCDWGEVCESVPSLGQAILDGIKRKELNDPQLQILETLQCDVCGVMVCVVQWLWHQEDSEERGVLARALQTFIDLASTAQDHRRHFMASTAKKMVWKMLEPRNIPSPSYPWLINCGRHELPQLGAGDIPGEEHLRQGFIYALRQGWACSGVLDLVEKCGKVMEEERWTKAWMEEMMKVVSVEEMSLGSELCLGVSLLCPSVSLPSLSGWIMDFVTGTGNELYCVAPRGTVLAKFMVHAYVLAFQLAQIKEATSESMSSSGGGWKEAGEEPQAKVRRVESQLLSDPEVALKSVYKKFSDICEEGEVRPGVYFVASFLRLLSEHTNPAAKRMIALLPSPLLHQVIRIDPKIISAPTVMALHNLEERGSRQRALQNLCLLRQLRAL